MVRLERAVIFGLEVLLFFLRTIFKKEMSAIVRNRSKCDTNLPCLLVPLRLTFSLVDDVLSFNFGFISLGPEVLQDFLELRKDPLLDEFGVKRTVA